MWLLSIIEMNGFPVAAEFEKFNIKRFIYKGSFFQEREMSSLSGLPVSSDQMVASFGDFFFFFSIKRKK